MPWSKRIRIRQGQVSTRLRWACAKTLSTCSRVTPGNHSRNSAISAPDSQVLEQSGDRDPGPLEQPGTADLLRVALHRRALAPVEHAPHATPADGHLQCGVRRVRLMLMRRPGWNMEVPPVTSNDSTERSSKSGGVMGRSECMHLSRAPLTDPVLPAQPSTAGGNPSRGTVPCPTPGRPFHARYTSL